MKHIIRLPVLTVVIAMAAALMTLGPTPTNRACAQETGIRVQSVGYYGHYGHRRSGRYRQNYYGSRYNYGHRSNGYSSYQISPYRFGNSFTYGRARYIRSYGGSSYYQPYYYSNDYRPYGGGLYLGF